MNDFDKKIKDISNDINYFIYLAIFSGFIAILFKSLIMCCALVFCVIVAFVLSAKMILISKSHIKKIKKEILDFGIWEKFYIDQDRKVISLNNNSLINISNSLKIGDWGYVKVNLKKKSTFILIGNFLDLEIKEKEIQSWIHEKMDLEDEKKIQMIIKDLEKNKQ